MKSINYHIKAIVEVVKQLSKGKFWIYFLPGLVLTLIYFIATYRVSSIAESVSFIERIPLIGSYIDKGVEATFSVIGFIFDQLYIFAVITLLSPFNTYLSEKLDTELTGQTFKSDFGRIINDFVRMIFIVIIALFMEFILIGTWWIVAWIFGISDTIYMIISFLMAAFFFGFSFYDHSLERYNIGVFGSIGFSFQKIFLVTITGAIFQLIYYFPYTGGTPYIGIFIAPVLTTMISTVVYLYHLKKLPKNSSINSIEHENE